MSTVLDTLQKGTDYLERHGVDEARLNMQHLLAHVLRCERMQLYVEFDRPLDEPSLEKLRDLVKRRGKGEPLQHLLGDVDFLGTSFACDQRALVPRPETEELVDRLLKRSWGGEIRLLDMGTGSGVIGLSLVRGLGEKVAEAVLADRSPEALSLAAENRERMSLDGAPIRLVEGDLFGALEGRFDLIVANLPYIAAAEWTALAREVRQDPEMALVGGEEGTELMERFLVDSPPFVSEGGLLAMEFGVGQAGALRECATRVGYSRVEIVKDLCGNERFLFAERAGDGMD